MYDRIMIIIAYPIYLFLNLIFIQDFIPLSTKIYTLQYIAINVCPV